MPTGKKSYTDSDEPVFIDMLAVDVVVCEHRYMKLTPAEKRHAVHRLRKQGMSFNDIAELLRITQRTVLRLTEAPPQPVLDIDEHGNRFLVEDTHGQFATASNW